MIRRRHVLPSVGRAEISPEVPKLSQRRSRGSRTDLGAPGGEPPPGDST